MYRAIDRSLINPVVKPEQVRGEVSGYLRNHVLFTEIRNAYRKGRITKQELLTLRGQTHPRGGVQDQ